MKKSLIASILILGIIATLTMPVKASAAGKYDIIETTSPTLDLMSFDAFDENGLAWVEGEMTKYTYGDTSIFEHSYMNKFGQLAFPMSEEYYYYLQSVNGTCIILDRTFSENGCIAYSTADKHGLVDPHGEVILPPIYDDIGLFSEGLAVIKKDGKAGYINAKGELVLPMVYEDAEAFSEGLAAVKRDNKWGYIDISGQWVIEPQFYAAEKFYEGFAVVRDDTYSTPYSFIDRNGNAVFNKTFDHAFGFERGLAIVEIDNKWGAIDSTGDVVVPFIYFSLSDYGHEFLYATLRISEGINFKDGLVDRNGNVRIPIEYDNVYMDDETGLITVQKDGKWGVVDKNNQIIVPIEYDERIDFHDGYAAVLKDHTYGYVDTAGNLVVPMMYDMGLDFFDGVTLVRNNSVWRLIDASNNDLNISSLRNAQYDLVCSFSYGLARTKYDGKWGVIQLISYPDAWAQPEVSDAVSNGLVPESMQSYYTSDITRKDFCDLIIEMIEVRSGLEIYDYLTQQGVVRDFTTFYDIRLHTSSNAGQDMNILAAQALGIVNGKGDHTFDPYGKISRQEAATMLYRAGQLFDVVAQEEPSSYNDSSTFASWAESAIVYVSSVTDKTNGKAVMGGVGNNTFAPNGYLTHQQAIITMLRLYNAV